jgi:hypothetical protein
LRLEIAGTFPTEATIITICKPISRNTSLCGSENTRALDILLYALLSDAAPLEFVIMLALGAHFLSGKAAQVEIGSQRKNT